jgi:hypothetical protein
MKYNEETYLISKHDLNLKERKIYLTVYKEEEIVPDSILKVF